MDAADLDLATSVASGAVMVMFVAVVVVGLFVVCIMGCGKPDHAPHCIHAREDAALPMGIPWYTRGCKPCDERRW